MNFINRQGRTLLLAAVATVFVGVSAAFAQTKLTVSKNPGDAARFTNIQSAVNMAKPGDIIEILDAAIYEEQVTIDSSRNGITLRSKNPENLIKPVIKWRDTQNTSPKNSTEAKVDGDGIGASANFETCAALRIKRAKNVTVDGVIIDGGSPFVFGALSVWCPEKGGQCSGLFHGNAAIALIVAGGTQIRNCEFRNAYFGVYVKDRNIGGAFAKSNEADIDATIPLFNFGIAGNHLFEYNRVHDNAVGFFFESAWDLGSTVRYNLIYNNYYTAKTKSDVTTLSVEPSNQQPGAFLFKDNYLSPLAIYNNTFHNNYVNFIGNWQVGGQHLIFNNIFGQSSGAATGNAGTYYTSMMIDHMFPNRMKHSVFSVVDRQSSGFQIQCMNNYVCADNPNNPYTPASCFISGIRISNDFPSVPTTYVNLRTCNNGEVQSGTQNQSMVLPGAIISGTSGSTYGGTLPADANIRWLEMAGGTIKDSYNNTITLPQLFQSIDPASPNFLEPQWADQLVVNYIKNKGWPEAGIRNPDGTMADLGAIPSSSAKRQSVVVRVKPTTVVTVNGTDATIGFNLGVDGGELNNSRIRYFKWIYEIPNNSNSFGYSFKIVPATAVKSVAMPTTTLKIGNNNVAFTIPSALINPDTTYGFIEMTVEGMDKNGNRVTSDIGFLPYRALYSTVTLLYKAGVGGTLDGAATQTIVPGSDGRAVTAIANDGYKFTSWSDGVATAQRIDKNVTMGVNVTANFAPENQVSLIYNAGTGGVITGQAAQTIRKGGDGGAVRAVPNPGYSFVSWSDGVETAERIDLQVQANITVTAAFRGNSFALNYSAGSGGRLMGTAAQTVERGSDGGTVVALANDGYGFVSWSDGVKTAERTDVNVTNDITVTAIFGKNSLILKYRAGVGGSLTGTTEQTIVCGSDGRAVTAIANNGYKFTSWSDGVTTAARTDKNVITDIDVTAYFKSDNPDFPPDMFTLNYNAGTGGRIVGTATQTVTYGSNGSAVTASPNEGYKFTSWSDGVTTAERTDKSVSNDINVTANFIFDKYTLRYKLGLGGKSLLGDSLQFVSSGASGAEVYVVAEAGYTFARWSDGSTDNPRTDKNVKDNITVTAYFADPNGHISVNTIDRVVPSVRPATGTAAVSPVSALTAEFIVGPNPADKSNSSAAVNFFRHGAAIKSAALSVYDASGKVVRKVAIKDKAAASNIVKRSVGSWDLRDARGRQVSEGTYLVKGVIKTVGGKRESVSAVVGVK